LKPFESFCSQKAVKKSDTSRACCGETSPSMNRRALVRNRTFPSAIRFTVIFGGSHHSFFVRGPPSRKNLGEAFKQQSKASGTAHVLASLLKQCLLVNPKKLMPSFRRQLTPELYHYFKTKLVSSHVIELALTQWIKIIRKCERIHGLIEHHEHPRVKKFKTMN